MKRTLLLLMSVLASLTMSAYSYHPFLKEGKTWNYEEFYHNMWTDEQWKKDVSYAINGTTEIDGKTYYKMYRTSEEGTNYFCALREEDRKVWQYTNDEGEHLLYDFGMSVGDGYIMPSYETFYYQLTSIEPMWFHDDQLLNVLHYDVWMRYDPSEPGDYMASAYVVEGVGCEEGWNIMEMYAPQLPNGIIHGESFLSCYEDEQCIFTADDFNGLTNPKPGDNMAYRPLIEEGKVWKVGYVGSNPVQWVEYYYLDGDTIIGGRACKQMMCQRYVSPEHPDYDAVSRQASPWYVGAWYEEDKKVYFYDASVKTGWMVPELKYDFSAAAYDTLMIGAWYCVAGPRKTGGMNGFKGVYRDVWGVTGGANALGQDMYRCAPWLEGVGSIYGPPTTSAFNVELADPSRFLMSCTVGGEVIYLNDAYVDGATPDGTEARRRFDFTHTIKTRPKAPERGARVASPAEAEPSLYGEYSNLQLDLNLNPLDDTYQVYIADETGKAVYERTVNAVGIVGLNIDISAYTAGRYTVTVENGQEAFTGVFETLTTGIDETGLVRAGAGASPYTGEDAVFNLQGQRISSLRKGLNIVNRKKVYVW